MKNGHQRWQWCLTCTQRASHCLGWLVSTHDHQHLLFVCNGLRMRSPNLQLEHPSGCSRCCSQAQWHIPSRGLRNEKDLWYQSSSTTTCLSLLLELSCSDVQHIILVFLMLLFSTIFCWFTPWQGKWNTPHVANTSLSVIWGKLCYF